MTKSSPFQPGNGSRSLEVLRILAIAGGTMRTSKLRLKAPHRKVPGQSSCKWNRKFMNFMISPIISYRSRSKRPFNWTKSLSNWCRNLCHAAQCPNPLGFEQTGLIWRADFKLRIHGLWSLWQYGVSQFTHWCVSTNIGKAMGPTFRHCHRRHLHRLEDHQLTKDPKKSTNCEWSEMIRVSERRICFDPNLGTFRSDLGPWNPMRSPEAHLLDGSVPHVQLAPSSQQMPRTC